MIEVKKNPMETIRFQVTEYRGNEYADIRVYYQDDKGEWKPTKKGITIRPDLWPEFREAIDKLQEVLIKEDLVTQKQVEEISG